MVRWIGSGTSLKRGSSLLIRAGVIRGDRSGLLKGERMFSSSVYAESVLRVNGGEVPGKKGAGE